MARIKTIGVQLGSISHSWRETKVAGAVILKVRNTSPNVLKPAMTTQPQDRIGFTNNYHNTLKTRGLALPVAKFRIGPLARRQESWWALFSAAIKSSISMRLRKSGSTKRALILPSRPTTKVAGIGSTQPSLP